jgi:hypothetical protein
VSDQCRIGSFYAFILSRSDRVRLTVVARSNYDSVCANVSPFALAGSKKKWVDWSPDKGITINSENHGQHTFHPHQGQ